VAGQSSGKMTLLCLRSSHAGLEFAKDGAADVALEATANLAVTAALGASSGDVVAGCGVVTHACADDDVEGAIELAVPRPGQAVTAGVACGCWPWRDPAERCEGCFGP